MKPRKAIALGLILVGSIVASLSLWVGMTRSTFGLIVTIILGLVLILAGILIFITEVLESWLGHSQAALVDGLQAG